MFGFLFGKDTAESLVAEVFATLQKYKDLQTRIHKVSAEVTAQVAEENARHWSSLSRLETDYNRKVERETETYSRTTGDYTTALATLDRGTKVASKIVSFFEDE